MSKFHETRFENTFNVDTLIHLGNGYRMREHLPDSPCMRDGKEGVVYDFWQLIYMEDGSYHCQLEDAPPCLLEKGQLLICSPKKVRFSYESSTAVVGIISIRCSSPKMNLLKGRCLSLLPEEKALLSSLFEKGSQLLCLQTPDGTQQGQLPVETATDYQLQTLKNYIELLLISLYDRCLSTQENGHMLQNQLNYYEDKFHFIEDFMKANLYRTLTIDEILNYAGFSLNTVKRIFQRQANCGIIHYFLKLKIQEAQRLLCETSLTVTQISDMLGFSSVHYFSNTFKKFTGVSPSKYAKSGMT